MNKAGDTCHLVTRPRVLKAQGQSGVAQFNISRVVWDCRNTGGARGVGGYATLGSTKPHVKKNNCHGAIA